MLETARPLKPGEALTTFVETYTFLDYSQDTHHMQRQKGIPLSTLGVLTEGWNFKMADCRIDWKDPHDGEKVGFRFDEDIVKKYKALIEALACSTAFSRAAEKLWEKIDAENPGLNLNTREPFKYQYNLKAKYVHERKINLKFAEFKNAYFVMDFFSTVQNNEGGFEAMLAARDSEDLFSYILEDSDRRTHSKLMKEQFKLYSRNPKKYKRERNAVRDGIREQRGIPRNLTPAEIAERRAALLAPYPFPIPQGFGDHSPIDPENNIDKIRPFPVPQGFGDHSPIDPKNNTDKMDIESDGRPSPSDHPFTQFNQMQFPLRPAVGGKSGLGGKGLSGDEVSGDDHESGGDAEAEDVEMGGM